MEEFREVKSEIDLESEMQVKTVYERYHELTNPPAHAVLEKMKKDEGRRDLLGVIFAMGVSRGRQCITLCFPTAILSVILFILTKEPYHGFVLASWLLSIGYLMLSAELWDIAKKKESFEKRKELLREFESLKQRSLKEDGDDEDAIDLRKNIDAQIGLLAIALKRDLGLPYNYYNNYW